MKLSDFGLCKPLDCSHLSSINENEVLDDENLNDTMDVDGSQPNIRSGRRWKSPLEQLQHWQMIRRKLAFCTVGTPDYIAPEVLLKKGYGAHMVVISNIQDDLGNEVVTPIGTHTCARSTMT